MRPPVDTPSMKSPRLRVSITWFPVKHADTNGGFRDYQAGIVPFRVKWLSDRQYAFATQPFDVVAQETSPVEGFGVYDLLECLLFLVV